MTRPTITFPPGTDHALAAATVHHRLLVKPLEQCRELLSSLSDVAFLLVVGASGSGKSHLLRLLYLALLDQYAPEMAADPDVIPVLMLNAPAPPDGTFRWRSLGAGIFEAARIPAAGRPSKPRFASADPTVGRARTYGMTVDEVLREAMRACLDRGVRVIILDEAGHLANVAYSLRPRQQLDVLKGLAQEAGVRFVLAGPYDLLDFRDASAQIGRRSRLVHVAPYRIDVARERTAFGEVADAMLELIGVELRDGPDWHSVLHEGSLGCVGVLRDWLVDAEHAFRRRAGGASFEECLAEFRRTRGELRAIGRELALGAARLESDRTGAERTTAPKRPTVPDDAQRPAPQARGGDPEAAPWRGVGGVTGPSRPGLALLGERSALLGVEPQGAGTPLAEHAASVIVRAAWRNDLSLSRVIDEVAEAAVEPAGMTADERAAAVGRLEDALGRRGVGLLGTNRAAATWVDWYERLSRRPGLARHTLLPLARVLPARGALRLERAYCPEHLRTWHADGVVYEPLLWQLRAVTVCPYHPEPVRLETRCPNPACRAARSVLTAAALPGRCERCGTPLWMAPAVPVGGDEWAGWVATELGELVASLASVTEPPAGASLPGEIRLAIARSGGSLTAFAASVGVALSTASLWKDGRRQPSLDGILRLCRVAGFRVADFLLERTEALEAAPVPAVRPSVPVRTTTYRDIDWRGFRRALARAARDERCPAPTQVARRWRIDEGQARRACPELWARLVARHRDCSRHQSRQRAANRERAVAEAVGGIHAEGRYPSRHQVQKRAPRSVSFRDPLVRRAWASELGRLGYRRRRT